MPLVLICGIPCSGKSWRAEELRSNLATDCHVAVIDEPGVTSGRFDRDSTFGEDRREKELRGQLRSETQKLLSSDTIVVLDAGNYVKGFRYELYCLSKSVKTTHCVLHCETAPEEAWTTNSGRDPAQAYARHTFDALCARFEAPDSRGRWDSPLFVVRTGDPLPLSDIRQALLDRRPPPPNLATQCQPLQATNFLYELDRVTQEVVKWVLDSQKNAVVGEEVILPGTDARLRLTRTFSAMELARQRRQYIVYAKQRPVDDSQKMSAMFVQYLNSGILQ